MRALRFGEKNYRLSGIHEFCTVVDPMDAQAQQPLPAARLHSAIERAVTALKAQQHEDGYWCTEFEADCTIPAEYVLLNHFMNEVDDAIEQKIGVYLRAKQEDHGGWSLYPGGNLDISGTVKAYFALKIIGDSPDQPHMVRAREAVLARGGAVNANVFTHIALALFEQIPWRGVPFIPVEIMLFPSWFPFTIRKVSYWSRTVMVPLFVLCTLKPKAANPRRVGVSELFVTPPEQEHRWFKNRSLLNGVFIALDKIGRLCEPLIPGWVRRRAIGRAEAFVIERLNGRDGLGGIFPAMVNAYEMLAELGYRADHPYRVQTRAAIDGLLVETPTAAYCQPCLSPVWDTGLSCLALQVAVGDPNDASVCRGLDWLAPRQLLDEPGDWQWQRPRLRGGGWAFQFENAHYPDIDDTPVVAWSMLQTGQAKYAEAIERAAEWTCGMQSRNGGWASFDVDNCHYYLNEIPFADHGALLDPPTSDVTARCISFLAKKDPDRYRATIARGLAFLRSEQEDNGSWFGRWGTNYIYGTWSVLTALREVGMPADEPMIRRAVAWLESKQRADGGWAEDNYTYFDPSMAGEGPRSTSFQSAWAVLGLVAAGEQRSQALARGAQYLVDTQSNTGLWFDQAFTAPGFPRVFYLKYHGYSRYFPLWALAHYRDTAQVA